MASLAHTLALLAMTVSTVAIIEVSLDMAWDSFDDQYRGCGHNMTAALPALNSSEFQKNPLFARAWEKAVAEWQRWGSPVSPLSSPDQAIAIRAFTMDDLRAMFNIAVREAGSSPQEYRDNFHYKTLHFLLTQALETLSDAREGQCLDVFHQECGVEFVRLRDSLVRFGEFTVTWPSKPSGHNCPGEMLIQLHTCHGAGIQPFTQNPKCRGVLIPPFETFEVTQVTWEENKTLIQLRYVGTHSRYNCEWLRDDTTGDSLEGMGTPTVAIGTPTVAMGTPTVVMGTPTVGGIVSSAPFHHGELLLATTAVAVATRIL